MPTAKIGSLVVDIVAGLGRFGADMGKAGGLIGRFAKNSKGAFTTLGKVAAAATGAITGLAAGVVALGVRGAGISATAQSFENLARSVGDTGENMLALTRDATKGLVKDLDIMSASNKALLLGLPVTGQEMASLAKTATVLGRAMGQDATKSLDDLITALGRSSPLILDNLGLTVSVGEANRTYAAELGIAVKAMTDSEKQQAFMNASLREADRVMSTLGEITLTMGERISIATIAFQNFVDELSVAIARSPVLNAALAEMHLIFSEVFTARRAATVDRVIEAIEAGAKAFVSLGEMTIGAARAVLKFFIMLEDFNAAMFRTVAAQLELADAVSFGIGPYGELAIKMRENAAQTTGYGNAAAELRGDLDDLNTAFSRVGAAMEEAGSEARVELEPSIRQVARTARDEVAPALETAAAATTQLATEEQAAATAARELDTFWRDLQSSGDALKRETELVSAAILKANTATSAAGVVMQSFAVDVGDLAQNRLPALAQNMSKANLEAIKAPGIFESIGSSLVGLKDQFLNFGNVTEGIMQGVFGPGGFIASLAQQGMNKLGGLVLSGLKKVGGFFKDIFGGPSAKELAGREIVENFQSNMSQILTDAQRIEAGGETWKATNIAVRDTYVAIGLSEQEAMADVQALYDAIKAGPDAVNPALARIQARMEGLGAEIAEADSALTMLTRPREIDIGFNVGRPDLPDLGSPLVRPMAEGGIGRVTGPALFAVESGVTEDFAFSGAGKRFGGSDEIAGLRSDMQRFMRSQPDAIGTAIKDAFALMPR